MIRAGGVRERLAEEVGVSELVTENALTLGEEAGLVPVSRGV